MEEAQGRLLVQIARATLLEALGEPVTEPAVQGLGWLQEPGASFVTLERHGELRGCVGTLTARRSLLEDVRANARHAAFEDRRFPPLRADELDGLSVKVSVLSNPEPVPVASEQELLDRLRPGVDGLVLEYGVRRATFLPQVWEQLPDPAVFLDHLRHKAGLERGFWSSRMVFHRYSVESWGEGR